MNCASRLTSTRPLLISSKRYAFSWSAYLRNRHFTARASNLVRFCFGTVTYAWQPNTFRFASSGFLPVHTWFGDLSWLMARVGQYDLAKPACSNMQRAHSTSVRFIRSATPFS
ncbi:uncharacterized protein PITG_22004 [Phytophthora infestans T30-4]|uniref:Uncharacterized protein n=1 Tax=Phytophthora infestans (strain T30-4) TaxID=403677 RepID=D0RLT3_PHYIT|nr:uncharacterized protein PITG_22004 [Phytophthora infestans T30-4]EEY69588.1 hypothetical protein PITG_22004 [Phytophthora infestans T30-4]|eukprot:XP_002999328.1 hypothetical protein PITG_22004 [Phytophthora infestans T30-4]